MKALLVLLMEFPNDGSWEELNETFTACQEVPYSGERYLIVGEEDIEGILRIAKYKVIAKEGTNDEGVVGTNITIQRKEDTRGHRNIFDNSSRESGASDTEL